MDKINYFARAMAKLAYPTLYTRGVKIIRCNHTNIILPLPYGGNAEVRLEKFAYRSHKQQASIYLACVPFSNAIYYSHPYSEELI